MAGETSLNGSGIEFITLALRSMGQGKATKGEVMEALNICDNSVLQLALTRSIDEVADVISSKYELSEEEVNVLKQLLEKIDEASAEGKMVIDDGQIDKGEFIIDEYNLEFIDANGDTPVGQYIQSMRDMGKDNNAILAALEEAETSGSEALTRQDSNTNETGQQSEEDAEAESAMVISGETETGTETQVGQAEQIPATADAQEQKDGAAGKETELVPDPEELAAQAFEKRYFRYDDSGSNGEKTLNIAGVELTLDDDSSFDIENIMNRENLGDGTVTYNNIAKIKGSDTPVSFTVSRSSVSVSYTDESGNKVESTYNFLKQQFKEEVFDADGKKVSEKSKRRHKDNKITTNEYTDYVYDENGNEIEHKAAYSGPYGRSETVVPNKTQNTPQTQNQAEQREQADAAFEQNADNEPVDLLKEYAGAKMGDYTNSLASVSNRTEMPEGFQANPNVVREYTDANGTKYYKAMPGAFNACATKLNLHQEGDNLVDPNGNVIGIIYRHSDGTHSVFMLADKFEEVMNPPKETSTSGAGSSNEAGESDETGEATETAGEAALREKDTTELPYNKAYLEELGYKIEKNGTVRDASDNVIGQYDLINGGITVIKGTEIKKQVQPSEGEEDNANGATEVSDGAGEEYSFVVSGQDRDETNTTLQTHITIGGINYLITSPVNDGEEKITDPKKFSVMKDNQNCTEDVCELLVQALEKAKTPKEINMLLSTGIMEYIQQNYKDDTETGLLRRAFSALDTNGALSGHPLEETELPEDFNLDNYLGKEVWFNGDIKKDEESGKYLYCVPNGCDDADEICYDKYEVAYNETNGELQFVLVSRASGYNSAILTTTPTGDVLNPYYTDEAKGYFQETLFKVLGDYKDNNIDNNEALALLNYISGGNVNALVDIYRSVPNLTKEEQDEYLSVLTTLLFSANHPQEQTT